MRELETPVDLRKVVKRWWLLVLAVMVLGGAVGYWSAARQPAEFESVARVLVVPPASEQLGSTSDLQASQDITGEQQLATSDATIEIVRASLGLTPDQELPEGEITVEDGSQVLRFEIRGSTAENAQRNANVWADSYLEIRSISQLTSVQAVVDTLQTELASLRETRQTIRQPLLDLDEELITAGPEQAAILSLRRATLESELESELVVVDTQIASVVEALTALELRSRIAAVGSARVITAAVAPEAPLGSPAVGIGIAGSIVGLTLGLGVALVAAGVDGRVHGATDLSEFGLPILGQIPAPTVRERVRRRAKNAETITLVNPEHRISQAYYQAWAALRFAVVDLAASSVVITSANANEGKSSVWFNLSAAFARNGQSTFAVDADLRRPSGHTAFGIDRSPGLSELILDEAELPDASYRIKSDQLEELVVVPSGGFTDSPDRLLSSDGFGVALKKIKNNAEIVLVDSAPLSSVVDSLALVESINNVVLVVRCHKTKSSEVAETVARIRSVNGSIVGIVLVGASGRRSSYSSYTAEVGSNG